MNRSFAFKLCGELADLGMKLSYSMAAGDTALTCVTAGVELLDMTSSLVSFFSARSRTTDMMRDFQFEQAQYQKMMAAKMNQAEAVLAAEERLSNARIQALKVELEQERNMLMMQLEEASNKNQVSFAYQMRKNELIKKIRDCMKETIDLVSTALTFFHDQGMEAEIMVFELQEQLRISTIKYTKFVKVCC